VIYPFVPLTVSFPFHFFKEDGGEMWTHDPRAVSRPIPLYGIVDYYYQNRIKRAGIYKVTWMWRDYNGYFQVWQNEWWRWSTVIQH